MKKSMELDIADLSDILEGFVKKLDKLTEPDLIDLAARLKPVVKHCTAIDEFTKEFIKEKLKGKDGERLGGMFKAVLTVAPTTRLDQKAFKEAEPELYSEYTVTKPEGRVTFSLR